MTVYVHTYRSTCIYLIFINLLLQRFVVVLDPTNCDLNSCTSLLLLNTKKY